MTPLERVLGKLPSAKQSGNGYSARCPAHKDRNPSLSIAQGDNGGVVVRCFAGCSADAICAALGLRLADLMRDDDSRPVNGVNVNGNHRTPRKTALPLTADSRSGVKTFRTATEAVGELERRHGPRSAMWTYHDAQGEPVGVVVRWDRPGGKKDIRPVSLHADGWRIGGMLEPRPLFGLPDLVGANRVYVCEGEKAAEAVRSIGLVATTSAHGAESFAKTDWRPLAGKKCVLLPDNDSPGRTYADNVSAILATLTPAATVKLVELPDLPDGGDMADFVAMNVGTDADELRRIVEGMADAAEVFEPLPSAENVERFKPFPVEALPQPVRGFVAAGARAIGCDPSYLALPLLTALGAAIGTTRRLQLKRGWDAPAIIWSAIVGESGTAKTPAFQLVMKPVRDRQRKAFDIYKQDLERFEGLQLAYEKELTQWKRSKQTDDDPPEKPEPKEAVRYVVSDTTVEALAPILLANPRGLLLARDELAGWLGSFDRYAGGKGSADAGHWLSMFNGVGTPVDRKTGQPRIIYVPHAAVWICGGIQPGILHRALGQEHRESGLAARLLLACPPRKPKRWTEADIDPRAEQEIARLFDRLFDLEPATDDEGQPQPVTISLTREAKALWIEAYNAHALEQSDISGDLAASWSKLEEYAARLALIVHYIRWAADDPTLERADAVDAASMSAGIDLVRWFKHEARRVYGILAESEEDRDRRRLVEWLERRREPPTARDVQMGCRWLRESGTAEKALEDLVKAGLGAWEQSPAGQRGQPTRRFRLSTVNGNTPLPDETGNTVDVDTVDAPESHDDDWGEF